MINLSLKVNLGKGFDDCPKFATVGLPRKEKGIYELIFAKRMVDSLANIHFCNGCVCKKYFTKYLTPTGCTKAVRKWSKLLIGSP